MTAKKFDLRTHIRDPKTGKVTEHQPYTLTITDGQRIYTRHGVRYFENGDQVNPAEKPIKPKTEKELREDQIQKAMLLDESSKQLEQARKAFEEEKTQFEAKKKAEQEKQGSASEVKASVALDSEVKKAQVQQSSAKKVDF